MFEHRRNRTPFVVICSSRTLSEEKRLHMSAQTAAPEAITQAAGLAVSGIVKVTNLFVNQAGPLPKTKAFTSSGGTLVIFVSGSLSTSNPALLLVMNIDFDGNRLGTCQEWINV